ncbi:LVIVD repeat-containing protein [Antrihabitans sp. YC2-6]|uniref:LVIVD repeat-containing protein n=1 Tax=Antrihabitans sp. YC2-6 TaxID=2799498 RepID=UPI0035A8A079
MVIGRLHKAVALISGVVIALAVAAVPASAQTYTLLDVGNVAVPRAECGPGSLPETGLQGDVPAEDRNNLRSTQGYRCNMSLLGGLQDRGGGILSVTYDHCSYTSTFFPGNLLGPSPGVQVLYVSDPSRPVMTTSLNEPAMLAGTWESLKVNKKRALLAATAVPVSTGTGYFSIYDISDCAHPRLLNRGAGTDLTMPLWFLSHEGGFSPDGNTYWTSGTSPGFVSAIDVTDPANPRIIWQGLHGLSGHGFGISPDGNRMYLSNMAGMTILDISAVQRRDPYPAVPQIATYFWTDGHFNQHSIPVTYDRRPYLFTLDEAGSGGVKVFDISDEANAQVVQKIKLEINLDDNMDQNVRSASGGSVFAYDPHYCAVDRPANPTALACSWISSGIRVFDVRNVNDIREIAYYNPPAQTHKNLLLTNSAHALSSIIGVPLFDFVPLARSMFEGKVDPSIAIGPRIGQIAFGDLSSDWCLSPPEFHGNQIWTSCMDNGFMALQLDNGVYQAPADQDSTIGS